MKKKKELAVLWILPFWRNHRIKIKENEKINKFLDLARKLIQLWSMRGTMISIELGSLGTVPKGLEKRTGGIGNQVTNRDYSMLRLVRIHRKILETLGDSL